MATVTPSAKQATARMDPEFQPSSESPLRRISSTKPRSQPIQSIAPTTGVSADPMSSAFLRNIMMNRLQVPGEMEIPEIEACVKLHLDAALPASRLQ
jgi:hypothetical protein